MASEEIEKNVDKYIKLREEYIRLEERVSIIEDEKEELLNWFVDGRGKEASEYLKQLRNELEGKKRDLCDELDFVIDKMMDG